MHLSFLIGIFSQQSNSVTTTNSTTMYSSLSFLTCLILILLVLAGKVTSTTVSSSVSRQQPLVIGSVTEESTNKMGMRISRSSSRSLIYEPMNLLRKIQRGGGGVDAKNGSIRQQTKLSAATTSSSTSTGSTKLNPFQVFIRTIQDGKKHLLSAAFARTSSIYIMYPIDVMKTRLQLRQVNPFRFSGIYNGVGGSLFGQVPYGVLAFGSYEMYKTLLVNKFGKKSSDNNDNSSSSAPQQPIYLYAVAAILGDLTGSGWICPSEVIKQQIQAGTYSNTFIAIRSIYQNQGLRGFYQGYLSCISRDVPFRVAQLTSFEITKSLFLQMKYRKQQQQQQSSHRTKYSKEETTTPLQLSPFEAAMCGAVSGTFSAAITAPLDRIKTLLMTSGTTSKYGSSVIQCATTIWKEEGIRGITTGMLPRVVYIAPSVVIFFVVYEMSQQRLRNWK